jgi:hypothetical protein
MQHAEQFSSGASLTTFQPLAVSLEQVIVHDVGTRALACSFGVRVCASGLLLY